MCLYFSMVVTTRGGGSGSTSSVEPMDERIHEFITSGITRDIMKVTTVMFNVQYHQGGDQGAFG